MNTLNLVMKPAGNAFQPVGRRLLPVLILAAGLGPARFASAASLDFDQALDSARERNESLQAAGCEVQQRQEEEGVARALHWPTVSLDGRYTRIDSPIVLDFDPIRQVILGLHPEVPAQTIPAFEVPFQDESTYHAEITAKLPLFTGGKIQAANRAAQAQTLEVKTARQALDENLTTEVVQRYFGLRLAQQARDVRAQVLEDFDTHLAQARQLESEGMIAKTERLHAEVARADADRELKRSEHTVQLAQTALANTLAADESPEPSSPLFLLSTVEPLDSFQTAAREHNPNLQRIAALKTTADEGVKIERAAFYPEVYAFGLYELYPDDLSPTDPEWAAGVGVSLPLFEGGARRHKVAAARDQSTRLALLETKARRDIATLVEQHYHELEQAREQYAAIESTLALADENLRTRNRAFEEGLSTSLEVVDARLALAKAKLERLAAAYDFDVALAQLLETCGEGSRFADLRAAADVEVTP